MCVWGRGGGERELSQTHLLQRSVEGLGCQTGVRIDEHSKMSFRLYILSVPWHLPDLWPLAGKWSPTHFSNKEDSGAWSTAIIRPCLVRPAASASGRRGGTPRQRQGVERAGETVFGKNVSRVHCQRLLTQHLLENRTKQIDMGKQRDIVTSFRLGSYPACLLNRHHLSSFIAAPQKGYILSSS